MILQEHLAGSAKLQGFFSSDHSQLEHIYVIVEKTSAPDNCHGWFWGKVAWSLLDNAAVSPS